MACSKSKMAESFLREHKVLIECYEMGLYCLNRHLNANTPETRCDTAMRLFGKGGDKSKAELFPFFVLADNEEDAADALMGDMSNLYLSVKSIANVALKISKRSKRKKIEQLDRLFDEILWFTQLASRYGFAIPPTVS